LNKSRKKMGSTLTPVMTKMNLRRWYDSGDEDESPYAARRPGEEADSDDEDDTPIPVGS
jgi:hypothetical protein